MTRPTKVPALQVRGLEVFLGSNKVLAGVDFCITAGQIACLIGPSGCGKTTLLRAVAGFEKSSSGSIEIGGAALSRAGVHVPPEKRNVGFVFQDYCLFPHLTVDENITLGLRDLPREEKIRKVREWTGILNLKGTESMYPHQLSGGQQQRVALARSLVREPGVLLLDEPFSNLDIDLKESVSREIRDVLKARGTAALWVTHDQKEAFSVADIIGVLAGGTLAQWGTSYELYHEPASRFVADFVGQGVFIRGRMLGLDRVETELGVLRGERSLEISPGTPVEVLLRPDDVFHDDASSFKAEIVSRIFQGPYILYTLRLPSGQILLSHVPSHHNHALGEKIGIKPDVSHLIAFPAA